MKQTLFEYESLPQLQNYRNQGNMIVLFRDSHGQPLYMLGPHYFISLIALFILAGLFIFLLISSSSKICDWKLGLLIATTVLFVLSYLQIIVSSPGLVKPNPNVFYDVNHPKYCQKCKLIKQESVRHCIDCDVCIYNYDHHCPWIGKCVGGGNTGKFYCFLFMLPTNFILFIIFTVGISSDKE